MVLQGKWTYLITVLYKMRNTRETGGQKRECSYPPEGIGNVY